MSIGLFLSACGARVTFHAGVVDALKEMGFEFDKYLGVSGGGIHAVLSACGCKGDLWFDQDIPLVQDKLILRPPILKDTLTFIFRDTFLKKYGGKFHLDEINKKVSVLTTERFFNATTFEDFASLDDLKLKLLASSSMPFFTSFPVTVKDKWYADGFFGYFLTKLDFMNLLDTKLRIISLALPTNHKPSHNDDLTYIFSLKKGKYNPFNIMQIRYDEAKQFYEDGYEQVMRSGLIAHTWD